MNEQELKEEAERLGWTVEYLKQHLAKERRIEKMFERNNNIRNEKSGNRSSGEVKIENQDKRKEDFQKKVKIFTLLLDDIVKEINSICEENKEEEYKDSLIEMIQALNRSQQTIKRAYNIFFKKDGRSEVS